MAMVSRKGLARDWQGKKLGRFGGIFDKYKIERTGGAWASKYQKHIKHWDIPPDKSYFKELFRISKKQIIWGGNYFKLPPSRNFIIWRKLTISETFTMAMAEYAWTNIIGNSKVFSFAPQNKERFHPTQKPVDLYKFILKNYAKEGDLILDTHVGSASSLIAYEEMGFEYVGCELDADYFRMAKERIEKFREQLRMF